MERTNRRPFSVTSNDPSVPVAATAISEGDAGLQRFKMALFEPVAPMLAQPADDI